MAAEGGLQKGEGETCLCDAICHMQIFVLRSALGVIFSLLAPMCAHRSGLP